MFLGVETPAVRVLQAHADVSREAVSLGKHGQDYHYFTGCENESSSSGKVVNVFHVP